MPGGEYLVPGPGASVTEMEDTVPSNTNSAWPGMPQTSVTTQSSNN